ncbi:MAG: OmpA family protein [Prevotellaceae bacterium]|jgi:outer membrane protein OmpA-like peptidoglycan-associated protein|nr:OmpA family protein [Prevotellaceae bacterium]
MKEFNLRKVVAIAIGLAVVSALSATLNAQGVKSVEAVYAKSDFVPGDEIFFEDNLDNETMGEFPSQWDLLRGNAEVASIDGKKAIFLEAPDTKIVPLMKNMKSYLPDVFTFEMDFWTTNKEGYNTAYYVNFYDSNGNRVMSFQLECISEVQLRWYYLASGDDREGKLETDIKRTNSWHHLSISFNKRAFKAYINGSRVTNVPNMDTPVRFEIEREGWDDHIVYVSNVRIAKGAVPLYDRMMNDGKFITYGITFDVGKSTIKPQSMGEINRIVTLMKENPNVRFSVEGHTDNTGSAGTNQTLSEARSRAVVDKLVEYGISRDRLKAAGKGQTLPIANNGTDEGRAKNRRVEFIKL